MGVHKGEGATLPFKPLPLVKERSNPLGLFEERRKPAQGSEKTP
ncbi:Putative hypothetical protein [Helicobacter mustelae 12198]|uniref:Uncharacterized protein n=1 Tax=Helicobacter mustelae (strain ATCC 43772 / CCUG 25715 / CIP 103759 / LMG 18044 / NCTC 12198 / R85-136P) TaxID=679897 RepID=D3UGQ0_HELM1|nr:Putative hypothetical protein [Helicobacter mustelae 12198]